MQPGNDAKREGNSFQHTSEREKRYAVDCTLIEQPSSVIKKVYRQWVFNIIFLKINLIPMSTFYVMELFSDESIKIY